MRAGCCTARVAKGPQTAQQAPPQAHQDTPHGQPAWEGKGKEGQQIQAMLSGDGQHGRARGRADISGNSPPVSPAVAGGSVLRLRSTAGAVSELIWAKPGWRHPHPPPPSTLCCRSHQLLALLWNGRVYLCVHERLIDGNGHPEGPEAWMEGRRSGGKGRSQSGLGAVPAQRAGDPQPTVPCMPFARLP